MLSKVVLVASALAASVSAQGVTAKISPTAPAPAGCTGTQAQPFNIAVVNATSASQKMKRQSQYNNADVLAITLTNGVLTDSQGRIGYIANNRQFQFDGPPQTGAIYTSGFSVCGNGTLALGGSTIWYECLSGAPAGSTAGSFYNLYDQSQGAQCFQIFIDALPVASSSSAAASSTSAVSQITDGQVQATTPASSLAAATQISDGQIQATTPASSLAAATQISDGQIQATTPASSLAAVTQISDGQIQATTPASSLKTTAVVSSVSRVSQISDGQIQATTPANGTVVRPTTVAPYLGNGAAVMTAAPAAAALGLAALFML